MKSQRELTWRELGTAPAGLTVIGRLFLAAVCLVAAMAAPCLAFAQPALVVNGASITYEEIEQRAKFDELANHKTQPRRETIAELIDDKLKVQDARRYKIVVTDKDIDAQYENVAKRMHITADQLTETLAQANVSASTWKAKLLADVSWYYVVLGLFRNPQTSGQSNGETGSQKKADIRKGSADDEYDYTLVPILFQVPVGDQLRGPANDADAFEAYKKEAEALRHRFTDCDSGLRAARALNDVLIRETITKNSSDLAYALREILANTELGHLTPVETTSYGVQVFAVCGRKENPSSKQAEAYLGELRRHADIRYVRDDIRDDVPYDRFSSPLRVIGKGAQP